MFNTTEEEGMVHVVAFLKVLCPAEITPDLERIHRELKGLGYGEIKPAEEYTPNGYDNRFVVWRYNGKDKLSDEEGLQLVGNEGSILYVWRCPRCGCVVRKCEFPANHKEDGYFGCSCRGTTWGVPIF